MTDTSTFTAVSGATSAIATCPSGKTIIGGGGEVSDLNNEVFLVRTRPFGNGWIATAGTVAYTATPPWNVTAWAFCATVAP